MLFKASESRVRIAKLELLEYPSNGQTMNGASRVCEGFRSQLSRRELLRAGGLGLLGMSLPELLAARAQGGFGKAKACILLFMWGDPAQQDTWDMKP